MKLESPWFIVVWTEPNGDPGQLRCDFIDDMRNAVSLLVQRGVPAGGIYIYRRTAAFVKQTIEVVGHDAVSINGEIFGPTKEVA